MRSRRLLAAALVVVAVLIVLVVRSGPSDAYRVDVEFDTARGMVPGQVIKIAGAKVGTLKAVHLTPSRKARMEFEVDRRFGPFRADASCKILPEGFISENYVQCDPGSPVRPPLRGPGGRGTPTVPVSRTSASVQLQQVIDTFSLPVDQRLQMILSELGIASAGRGEDLNGLLRRANPSLQQARRVLAVLGAQKAQIAAAVKQTDGVLTEVSRRDEGVKDFVDRVATVADETRAHRPTLSASIARTPPLLDQVQGRLSALERVTTRLTPTLRNLRAAVPSLAALNTNLPRFSAAGVPAVHALGAAAAQGRQAVRSTSPVLDHAATLTADAARPAGLARDFLESLRDRGGVEHVQDAIYGLANMAASFDEVSHILTFSLSVDEQCITNADLPGCSHKYDALDGGKFPVNSTPEIEARKPAPLPERTRRDLVRTLDRLLK